MLVKDTFVFICTILVGIRVYRIRIINKNDNTSDIDYNKTKIIFIIVIKILFY
jgi:hypothetical protein